MRIEALVGALAIALLGAGGAWAEAAGRMPAEPGGVPTVTIINKAPDGAAAAASNALSVIEETEAEGVLPPRVRETASDTDVDDAPRDEGAALNEDEEAETAEASAPQPPPTPTLHIDIDLTRQTMTVYEGTTVRHTWAVSSGRRGYATPTGTFNPTWMARQWFSRQYDNAPMPHSIFFHEGVAIHGSHAIRSLGRPASHGCVRLAPKNAATLFRMVTRHGKDRTRIVVHGTPNFGAPAVASREHQMPRGAQVRQASPYAYLPPSAAGRGVAASNASPSYVPPRARVRGGQVQAYAPRRPPRGLFTGYGF